MWINTRLPASSVDLGHRAARPAGAQARRNLFACGVCAMIQTRPEIIGFDDPPMSPAERVSELLHAARAAIVPPPRLAPRNPIEANRKEHPPASASGPEQIIHDLDQIARTLRSDDDLDRFALAAALDGVRDALTGRLAGQGLPASSGEPSIARIPPRSDAPRGATYDILRSERELRHATVEEARG